MSDNTAISWTDATFNPWWGCAKVSPACDHCYAERDSKRFAAGKVLWGVDADRRTFGDAHWNEPVRWNKRAEREGKRTRVFCASMADVFDKNAPDGARERLWALIEATPNLDWLLLTKRIGNVGRMIPDRWSVMLPENVWLGATVVNQEEADRDVPKLLAIKVGVRFLSIEPMLGQIDLGRWLWSCCGNMVDGNSFMGSTESACCGRPDPSDELDWVIVGGESGPAARPMHPDWVRSLRDQCATAGVPFHFKQWGEHSLDYDRGRDDPDYRRCAEMDRLPGRWINLAGGHGFNGDRVHYAHRVGKKAAGRLLDGVEHNGLPK